MKKYLNFSIEAFGILNAQGGVSLNAWGAASHCRYLKYLGLTY